MLQIVGISFPIAGFAHSSHLIKQDFRICKHHLCLAVLMFYSKMSGHCGHVNMTTIHTQLLFTSTRVYKNR